MPDHVREALFNLLRGHTEGVAVVDAFAGTGSVGIEALSRGATQCLFVERDREIAAILKQNIETLGLEEAATVVVGDALGAGALARCPRPVHLVFFDPPYRLITEDEQRPRVLEQFERLAALLDPEGFAVLRTPWPLEKSRGADPEALAYLRFESLDGPETHVYGTMAVHLYAPKRTSAVDED